MNKYQLKVINDTIKFLKEEIARVKPEGNGYDKIADKAHEMQIKTLEVLLSMEDE